MAHRRFLFVLTALCALLLIGSLSMVVHTRSERSDQAERIEMSHALTSALGRLNDRLDALVRVHDLASLGQPRQDLAQIVLAFDKDLLALSERVRDGRARAAAGEIQTIWRDLGLGLADLAAGEYATSSAAGQQVVSMTQRKTPALRQHLQTMTAALHRADQRTGKLSGIAATVAAFLGGLTLLLGLAASRPLDAPPTDPEPSAGTSLSGTAAADGGLVGGWPAQNAPQAKGPRSTPMAAPIGAFAAGCPATQKDATFNQERPTSDLAALGDLGLASAAVDRVALDMETVARSADRMQQAVDSVASALQGMLFSLNEMAQDTFEGSQLTRSAHNAAIYAADTARELLASARDMSTVVERVSALAAHSKEIAARIEADTAATGATGKAFTNVVAQEVKQLATATSDAAKHIEATVDEIMAGQRQHEEAIGQIIRNIGTVRKVAASMGELMLMPAHAPAAVPSDPLTSPNGLQDCSGEEPAQQADLTADDLPHTLSDDFEHALPDPAGTLQKADELVAATCSLLDELAEDTAETGIEAPQPDVAEPAEQPKAPEIHKAAEDAAAASVEDGNNNNVFMLNRPKADAAQKAKPEPAPAPAPQAPAEAEETVGAAAGPAKPHPVAQGSNGNIFILNKPKT